MEKSTLFVFGIFVVAVTMFVFSGNGISSSENVVVVGSPGEVVEIKTTLEGFKYSPDTVTVKKGSIIKLVIDNKDSVNHGLHLPEFGVVDSIPPRSIKTVQFDAIEASTNGQAVPTCSQEHGETLTIITV